jgi:hypothetical protein
MHEAYRIMIYYLWIYVVNLCIAQIFSILFSGKKALNGTDGYDEYHISTIHKHDNYNNNSHKYDIALVQLSQKINRKLELLPVCLWDKTIRSIFLVLTYTF